MEPKMKGKIMRVDDFGQSDYLKQGDVEPPILVTIKSVELKNMAKDNQPQEMKPVIEFYEITKRLACNKTNFKRICKETGEADSDDWDGKKIVLWFNEDIEFGGEQVGGIRVRGATQKPVQEPYVPSKLDGCPIGEPDDSIPF